MKKWISFCLALCLLLGLCGCHKGKQLEEFNAPMEFDTSREFTITFWAKMRATKTRWPFTSKRWRILRRCTPISMWS